METSGENEVRFAKRLAANEPKIRNKAIKQLSKFIVAKSTRGGGLSDDDLIKLWKGLFYCMWMQDKPLIQQELSARITDLIDSFSDTNDAIRFVKVCFMTHAREWVGIDKLRLDKFMMMLRDMLHKALLLVSSHQWTASLCQRLSAAISHSVMDSHNTKLPLGLRFHFTDIFVDELKKVDTTELTNSTLVALLMPFITCIIQSNNAILVKKVMSDVIEEVANVIEGKTDENDEKKESDGNEEEDMDTETENNNLTQCDIGFLLQVLFQLSQKSEVRSVNRAAVYDLVKDHPALLTNLSEDSEQSAELTTIVEAFGKTSSNNTSGEKKKKKRKRKNKESVEEDMEEVKANEESLPENKPGKKKKVSSETKVLTQAKNNNVPTSQDPSPKLTKKQKKRKRLSVESDIIESEETSPPLTKKKRLNTDEVAALYLELGKEKSAEDDSPVEIVNEKEKKPEPIIPVPNTTSTNSNNSSSSSAEVSTPKSAKKKKLKNKSPKLSTPLNSTSKNGAQKDGNKKSNAKSKIKTPDSDPGPVNPVTPKTSAQSESMTPGRPLTPGAKKKVVIDLRKNKANRFQDYLKSLSSPATLPDPTKSPSQSILKSPASLPESPLATSGLVKKARLKKIKTPGKKSYGSRKSSPAMLKKGKIRR